MLRPISNMPVPTFKMRPALLAVCALLLAYIAIWLAGPRGLRTDAAEQATNHPASAQSSKTSNTTPDSALSALAMRGLGPELDRILTDPDGPRRFAEFRRVLLQWIEQNPDAALASVKKMQPCAEYDDALLLVLPAVAKTNADRAIRLAREMAKTTSQRQIYAVLFDQVATNDLQAAVHLLDAVTLPEGRTFGMRAVAAVWAKQDIDGAVEWAKTLGTRDRQAAMETILEPLANEDPSRALDLAKENLAGPTLLQVASRSLIHLGADDATAAAELMLSMPPGIFQTPAALEVTRALADQAPDAVLNFLTNFASTADRRIALDNVLDIWSNNRPDDAAHYVAGMPSGEEQNQAAAHLAQRLAAADPDQAIEFANSLKSNPARDAAMLYIASGWARQDPAAAADWSVTIPADSTSRAEAIKAALSFWVIDDAKAAASWSEKLSPSDQIVAMRAIAPPFAQKDPDAAITWAMNLPAGESRDVAIQSVLDRWTMNQPERAAQWAQSAAASSQQTALVEHVASVWLKSNPSAARSWIERLSLSTETKSRLLGVQ